MNITPSPLSFTSKIKFVDNETFEEKVPFEKLNKKRNFVEEPFTKDQIIRSQRAYTEEIECCIAGGITEKAKGYVTMFHLRPADNIKHFNDVEQSLEKKSKITKDSVNKYTGLIVGGVSAKLAESDNKKDETCEDCLTCDYSRDLLGKVKQFYEGYKLPYTMFVGHTDEKQKTNIYYDGKKDTWLITTYLMDKRGNLENILDIKNAYENIKISEKDRKDGVWINGKKLKDHEIEYLEGKRKKLKS